MEIEELNGYDPAFGYPCSNEKVRIFLRILAKRKLRPKRVLSICSGGEVPLMCFLPIAEEVIAIDHSSRSLDIARTKIAVIKEVGVDGWYNLLHDSDFSQFFKTWTKAEPRTTHLANYEFLDIGRLWKNLPKAHLRVAVKRLDRLKLIHGDITDASSRGPFDLIYLSNALEHNCRERRLAKQELMDKQRRLILDMLAPNGLILHTDNGQPGGRIEGSILHSHVPTSVANWNYWIYQKGD